jgi:hypothetical protein
VLAGEVFGDILDGLARLQGDDAGVSQSGAVDVGGGVIDIVGDEDAAAVLGVADGVGRLSLTTLY